MPKREAELSARCSKSRPARGSAEPRRPLKAIALKVAEARDVLFLGRGTVLSDRARRAPEAEGDLLHPRRGYAAGEMKHGPIALIDDGVPSSCWRRATTCSKDRINLQEVRAAAAA
jgi:glucosamine--fructose-6-phosphate aminotransferase (isomerizing)